MFDDNYVELNEYIEQIDEAKAATKVFLMSRSLVLRRFTNKVFAVISPCHSLGNLWGYNRKMQLQYIQSIGILFHEDGQHYGEGQHTGSAIAQEGEGDSDDRH